MEPIWAFLISINSNLKLLWLVFGQFLENLGYFLFQHLVTLTLNNEKFIKWRVRGELTVAFSNDSSNDFIHNNDRS